MGRRHKGLHAIECGIALFVHADELMLCLLVFKQTGPLKRVVLSPLVSHKKIELSHEVSFARTQQENLLAFFSLCSFRAERQARAEEIIFEVLA